MKISAKAQNLGWKHNENSYKVGDFFRTWKWETDASYVHMSRLMCQEETWTFRHTNVPTVGPDIKSTGAWMRLQHAKG